MRFSRPTAFGRKAKLRAAALAVAVGGVGAAVLPSTPAVAYFSPPLFLDVEPQSPAHLVAGGAAVDVTVEYTCAGTFDGTGFLTVTVTQGVPGGVASGSRSVPLACSAQKLRTVVTVPASSGGQRFRTGSAFAEGDIFACARTFCGSEHDGVTIRIRR